ncbi:MAG TPA: hypothetical protein VGD27_09665 [Longimicrobiales bacterium]
MHRRYAQPGLMNRSRLTDSPCGFDLGLRAPVSRRAFEFIMAGAGV